MPDDRRPKIMVAYDPSFRPGSGVASTAYWRGSARLALNAMFGPRPNETIVGLVVDEDGITAYFGSKKP